MTYTANSSIAVDCNRNFAGQSIVIGSNNYLAVRSLPSAMGLSFGYTSGGYCVGPPNGAVNSIDRFPFNNAGTAISTGTLTTARVATAGSSSYTHGYNAGGRNPTGGYCTAIDKFSFAAACTNATNVGNLGFGSYQAASAYSATTSYTLGGFRAPPIGIHGCIDKFPFSIDSSSVSIACLVTGKYGGTGHSSNFAGFISGGRLPLTMTNIVERFSFSNETSVSAVGCLQIAKSQGAGITSSTHGYNAGGRDNSGSPVIFYSSIEKFPFSSVFSCTTVGNLVTATNSSAGISSYLEGFKAAGRCSAGSPPFIKTIEKFPFATDAGSICVGCLAAARDRISGMQV